MHAPTSRPPALPPRIATRFGGRPATGDDVLGDCDGVEERVALVEQLAIEIPTAAQFTAAAGMSKDPHETTVEQ